MLPESFQGNFLYFPHSHFALASFQYINATKASQYDCRLRRKSKERKEKLKLLTDELAAAKENARLADARRRAGRKRDAEEIEKLKSELTKHQEDAAVIADLRAQLA